MNIPKIFRAVMSTLTTNGIDRLVIRYDAQGNVSSWSYLPKGQGRPPTGAQGASLDTLSAYAKTIKPSNANPPTPPQTRKKSA